MPIGNGVSICFFNLHGAQALTEHCAEKLAENFSAGKLDEFFEPGKASARAYHIVHYGDLLTAHERGVVRRKI